MASKKHGTKPPQWWQHLRPYWRRKFWKKHRKDGKRQANETM